MKCWQIRRQTKAPQAAGTIHTDFEKGFICAEVIMKPSLIMLYINNFSHIFNQLSRLNDKPNLYWLGHEI